MLSLRKNLARRVSCRPALRGRRSTPDPFETPGDARDYENDASNFQMDTSNLISGR